MSVLATRAVRSSCPVIGPTSRSWPIRGLRAILHCEIFLLSTFSPAASCEPWYRSVPQESSLPRVTSMVPAARSSSSSHIHTRILNSQDQLPPAEARFVRRIDGAARGSLSLTLNILVTKCQ